MKKETFCVICNNKTKYQRKTCSRKCSDELKKLNNRESRICAYCKNPFIIKKTKPNKLCSNECRKKWGKLKTNQEQRIKNSQQAIKEKYNDKFFFETEEFKKKSKQTKKDRYGDENYVNIDKNKQTKKDRYGDENYNNIKQTQTTKEDKYGDKNYNNRKQAVNTMNELYGVSHAMKLKLFQKKAQKTTEQNFGVKFPLQNEDIKKKTQKTIQKKYNVDYISQHPDIKEKVKNTYYEKFDSTKIFFNLKNSNTTLLDVYNGIREKINNKTIYKTYNFKCEKCKNEFVGTFSNHRTPVCRVCYPMYKNNKLHIKIFNFLKENDIKFQDNTKKIIAPFELDFYISEFNLAIEINGNYWHSEIGGEKDKNYHLNKTKLCSEKGIKLIHIFEDELIFKTSIVKSRLLNEFKKTERKIYARKCEINTVDLEIKRRFLNENHLMGNSKDSVRVGLFYETKLISLMTFSKRRVALGIKESRAGDWELNRFCSLQNTNVIGGFQKLLKHFIKTYHPLHITTYADIRWSGILENKTVYLKNGFNFINQTPPSFWYFKKGDYLKRFHRFTYNKMKLLKLTDYKLNNNLTGWEIAQSLGMDRIWDCGTLKFNYPIKKEGKTPS